MNKVEQKQKTLAMFFEYANSAALPANEFVDSLEAKLIQNYISYEEKQNMEFVKKSKFPTKLGLAFSSIALLALAAFGVYNLLPQVSEKQDPKIGGELAYVEGSVEYQIDDAGWKTAEENMLIEENASFRVLGDGRLIINLDDGSALRAGSDSILSLESLDPKNIVVRNNQGEVFARVAKAERDFSILIDETKVLSLGTAFNTFNFEEEKGVQVFENKVSVQSPDKENVVVEQGNKIYLKNLEQEKQSVQIKLSKEEITTSEFIQWNKEKEVAENKSAAELGYLQEEAFGSISINVSANDSGITVSFAKTGSVATKGFKVLKSKTENPTFGAADTEAIYINVPTEGSHLFAVADGLEYNFRVCEYTGFGCAFYSANAKISAVAPAPVAAPAPAPAPVVKPAPTPTPAPAPAPVSSISITNVIGTSKSFKVFWTNPGNATQGYKVVYSQSSPNPTYGVDAAVYVSDPNAGYLVVSGLAEGNYNVRVCRYTGSSCDTYSQTVTVFVQPQ